MQIIVLLVKHGQTHKETQWDFPDFPNSWKPLLQVFVQGVAVLLSCEKMSMRPVGSQDILVQAQPSNFYIPLDQALKWFAFLYAVRLNTTFDQVHLGLIHGHTAVAGHESGKGAAKTAGYVFSWMRIC